MAVGLECKAPWCKKILEGQKTVELRQYPLPPDMIGTRVYLLASGGEEGVPALGDDVEAGSNAAEVVGCVVFSGVKEYRDGSVWAADEKLHCVPPGTPYSWSDSTEIIYGWLVGEAHAFPQAQPLPHMTRIKRSLYHMDTAPAD